MVFIHQKIEKKKRWILNLRDRLDMLGSMLILDGTMKDPRLSAAIRVRIRYTKKRLEAVKDSLIMAEEELKAYRKKHDIYLKESRKKYQERYQLKHKERLKEYRKGYYSQRRKS